MVLYDILDCILPRATYQSIVLNDRIENHIVSLLCPEIHQEMNKE